MTGHTFPLATRTLRSAGSFGVCASKSKKPLLI